jgi:hypothetical protein
LVGHIYATEEGLMPLQLVPLCEIDITLGTPIVIGEGPAGMRMVLEVGSATMTGDRISGHHHGSASADWVTVIDGVGAVDVRATLETDDGALVLVQYRGRTNLASGEASAPIYVAPTFETGAEQYRWLNLVQAVGVGHLDGTALHYEWFEVREP